MKTYLDSGVLLAAWRHETLQPAALEVMADETRTFQSSQMVRLEIMPKAVFEKRSMEVEFYNHHLTGVEGSEPLSAELGLQAQQLAERYGLSGLDALHVAAAIRLGAKELFTSEKPGKPMFRVKELKVISLHDLA